MDTSLTELMRAASTRCREDEFKRSVLRHCSWVHDAADVDRLNTDIHPRDQMLLHSLQHHRDADIALSQYFNISLQQHAAAMQVFRSFFDSADRSVSVLDFACGYGRLLRLLRLSLPTEQLWASEVQPDAVQFVADAFAVRALASHIDPQQFQPGRTFDFIWVASLFSHLPEPLFHAWLRRLSELLTPRGVLCFSTRSSDLLPADQSLPASGIVYTRSSELTDLDADVYGTTYVTEAFVHASVARALGSGHPCTRLRKALAHEQDLIVVCRNADQSLDALAQFRRGPWGWVDRCALSDTGELDLQGWAASLDDGRVQCVEIRIDGVLHECQTDIERPDVTAAFGDARMARSGWAFRAQLAAGQGVRLEVSARTPQGECALLFTGSICPRA
jgi:SAM-dependent methyltransferase